MRSCRVLAVSLGLVATSLVAQGLDPANLDRTQKPCEDFYQFANGTWLKHNPVPADKSRWGGFEELAERNRDVLKQILQEVSQRRDWPQGSIQQKVSDFYASGMDEAAIARAGLRPLQPLFKRIDRTKSAAGLAPLLAELRLEGFGAGFGFYVGQDQKQSTRYIGQLSQGGLGLPDRDYYLNGDPKSKELLAKYRAHVARMLELAGAKPDAAAKDADSVLAFETRLARASFTRV